MHQVKNRISQHTMSQTSALVDASPAKILCHVRWIRLNYYYPLNVAALKAVSFTNVTKEMCWIYSIILCVDTSSLRSFILSVLRFCTESQFSVSFCCCPILVWFNFISNFYSVICFSVSLNVSHHLLAFVASIFLTLECSGVVWVGKEILMHTHTFAHVNKRSQWMNEWMSVESKKGSLWV